MADNDYGSGISRFLDPEGTNFDVVVYQKGKAVLDSELVLSQDLARQGAQNVVKGQIPSGFLSGDFSSDEGTSFSYRAESNAFYLVERPIVHVNGWVFPLEYTNTATPAENLITLAGPPASAGSIEVDFVYLEVWRAVVAPGSTENKPAVDKLWNNGNTASDSSTWLDDNLIDTDVVINVETTQRVQIQYRLRSQRLTSTANKIGYTDANLLAYGTSLAQTALPFVALETDPGLWRAGNGDPSNTLGTTDGYVYSIPVALVYRRNNQPFDYLGNGNGGALLSAGSSDRPDGYYADVVVADDVQDLRRHVSLTGHDMSLILERSISLLMDRKLNTWATNTALTGYYVGGSELSGTRWLKADDLVASTGVPSDPASGNSFGAADGIRTVFSDRPILEQHVKVFSAPPLGWVAGSQVIFDLDDNSSLGQPLSDEQPSGTVISNVGAVVLNEGSGTTGVKSMALTALSGVGSTRVEITLGASPVPGSLADIWVVYEVLYPAGSGLNAHVDAAASNFTLTAHDPTAFNSAVGTTFSNDEAGRSSLRSYIQVAYEQGPHREVSLTHTTDAPVTLTVFAQDVTTVLLPEYLFEEAVGALQGVVTVTQAGGGASYTVDPSRTAGRQVGIDGTTPLPSGATEVDVTFYPSRPLPTNGSAMTLYYMTVAIPAIQFEYLTNGTADNDLVVQPVAVSPLMRIGTAGSGSPLTSFPYEAPMGHIPVHINSPYNSEAELSAPGPISIDDFDANTGFAQLPLLIPMAPVSEFTFKSPVNVTTQNAEFIDHFTSVDLDAYRPSAFAQSLSSFAEHKVFIAFAAKLKQDTDFARKGEHVLVVVANYLETSSQNRVGFADTNNTTCAAIYRLKGNPLSH